MVSSNRHHQAADLCGWWSWRRWPGLGQQGVNIMEFGKQFNVMTQKDAGLVIPVVISVYQDKSFTFITKISTLLKRALNIAKGLPLRPREGRQGDRADRDREAPRKADRAPGAPSPERHAAWESRWSSRVHHGKKYRAVKAKVAPESVHELPALAEFLLAHRSTRCRSGVPPVDPTKPDQPCAARSFRRTGQDPRARLRGPAADAAKEAGADIVGFEDRGCQGERRLV